MGRKRKEQQNQAYGQIVGGSIYVVFWGGRDHKQYLGQITVYIPCNDPTATYPRLRRVVEAALEKEFGKADSAPAVRQGN